jgi:hypothetical protein
MSYKDFAKVEYLPFGESVELMKNRQLDATLISAGLGVAACATWPPRSRSSSCRFPPTWWRRSARRPTSRRPFRPTPTTARRRRAATVAIQNFLVTHEGVSTDSVYKMTKSMFDNLDQMVAAHAAAKAIKRENAAKAHAGAAASGRREVLPRSRPDQVRPRFPMADHAARATTARRSSPSTACSAGSAAAALTALNAMALASPPTSWSSPPSTRCPAW